MSTVKIVSGKGFTKQEAFAEKANYSVKFDATLAWKKAGSPVGDEFKEFAKSYLEKKVKSTAGIGFSVAVTSGVQDSRERPYTTEVVTQTGARKYKTVYQIQDSNEKILGSREVKSKALDLGKELVTALKTSVKVVPVKIVDQGEKLAAIITYTPSIKTKEGSYLFFGIEAE